MVQTLTDSYAVWWSDLRVLRRLWHKYLLTSLMSPVLYLLAFGFGLGRGMQTESVSYLAFLIPGIVTLTAMNTSFNATGAKLNVDRLFYRCFEEVLMAPVRPLSLVLGKSAVGLGRGLAVSLVFVLLGVAVASMKVTPLFVVTLIVTCFLFAVMSVLVAMLAKSHQDMGTYSSLILTPMTFFGGTFFSLTSLPAWLRVVIYIMPLTHASRCVRAEALGQPFPWVSLLILVGWVAALFWGSLEIVKRSSQ